MKKASEEKIVKGLELSDLCKLYYKDDDAMVLEIATDDKTKLICLGFDVDLKFIRYSFTENNTITLYYDDPSKTFSWNKNTEKSQRLIDFRTKITNAISKFQLRG